MINVSHTLTPYADFFDWIMFHPAGLHQDQESPRWVSRVKYLPCIHNVTVEIRHNVYAAMMNVEASCNWQNSSLINIKINWCKTLNTSWNKDDWNKSLENRVLITESSVWYLVVLLNWSEMYNLNELTALKWRLNRRYVCFSNRQSVVLTVLTTDLICVWCQTRVGYMKT